MYRLEGVFTASLLSHGDIFDPIKMRSVKYHVEKFADHIEDEVKQLYVTFPQKPMWL